ncbi:hypothetical protein D3C81_1726810 [compost metagenome]
MLPEYPELGYSRESERSSEKAGQPYDSETMSSLSQFIEFYTPRINAGESPVDVDRLTLGLASAEHVVHTTKDAGINIAFIFRI